MYSNGKLFVAPTVVLILILCVLSTDQTLFSRKKHFPTASTAPVDGSHQTTGSIPQKETSHWWQMKHKPESSDTTAGPNQVTVAAVPLVDIHQKLQSILESHVNSDVKWVPCLCPVRKTEFHHQLQQQQQQQQQQPQQQQQQQQHKQPHSSYYPTSTTQAPSIVNNVPRFIFANYQIEE